MARSSRARKISTLSESVQQRLNAYALAAGAAGVGILALAQPSEAKIVYTRADITLHEFSSLDLNHDGVNDLSFFPASVSSGSFLWLYTLHENAVIGYSTQSRRHVVSALKHRVRVGPKGGFESGKKRHPMVMWEMRGSTNGGSKLGPWMNVKHHYVGVKFSIKGKTHYGWVRLDVSVPGPVAVITGYAYETIPGKAIGTGQTRELEDGPGVEQPNPTSFPPTRKPATLGHLAAGSPVLSIWRQRVGG